MCIDFDGHHSSGSSFYMYRIFILCCKMWAIPTGTSSALKKNQVKSPSSVSHLGTRFGSANRVGPEIGV